MIYGSYRYPGQIRLGHIDDGEALNVRGKFPLHIERIQ